MADPTPYVPSYSYSGWQANNPTRPLPADEVDNDFAKLAITTREMIQSLRDVRRSDGALANEIVTVDSLSPSLSLGFSFQGTWTVGVPYSTGDGVVYENGFYRANTSHTAAADAPPGGAGPWTLLFSIDDIVVAGALAMPADTLTGDGGTVEFNLSFTPRSANNVLVSVGGVLQAVTEYSVNGNTLTFKTAPPAGYAIEVRAFATTATVVTPADGSVTEEKLDPGIAALLNDAMLSAVYDPTDQGTDVFDRSNHRGPVMWPVATRDALKLLDVTLVTVAQLTEEGRDGTFVWSPTVPVAVHQADPFEGIYVARDPAEDGAWVRRFAGDIFGIWFGALPGRANGSIYAPRANSALDWCRTFAKRFRPGPGSFFIQDTLDFRGVEVLGEGTGRWDEYTASIGSKFEPARTQFIMTGSAFTPINVPGISSMYVCGGGRVLAVGARKAYLNETNWRMLSARNFDATANGGESTPRDLRVGIICENSGRYNLEGFRIFADGGGDDGLDAYNDPTWNTIIDIADVLILQLGGRQCTMRRVQAVGHVRDGWGLLIASIDRDGNFADYDAPYSITTSECRFEGMRAGGLRGPDRFPILAWTGSTVDLPWAEDHPFTTATGLNHFRLVDLGQTGGGSSYDFTSVTKVNVGGEDRIRLSGVARIPDDAAFDPGSYLAVTPALAGGGNSHIGFRDTDIGGLHLPNGYAANDIDFCTNPVENGAIGGFEVSGWRLTEEEFDKCRVQHNGTIAFFLHDGSRGSYDVLTEANPTTRGDAGLRWIVSPQAQENTHTADANYNAGEYRFLQFNGPFINEFTGATGCDYAPFYTQAGRPSRYDGFDDGWFETYWANRPSQVRSYSPTAGRTWLPVPRLAVGAAAEGPDGFVPLGTAHFREETGFVGVWVEAVQAGADPQLYLRSRNGTVRISVDESSGNDFLIAYDAGNTGSYATIFKIEQGSNQFTEILWPLRNSNLPSVAPAAGTKAFWYDPADSNRIKFVP